MPLIIAKVTKRLVIPKKMRGIFPNEKELIIDLPEGVPVEVPKFVADYYIKNRPHIYRLASEPEPVTPPAATDPDKDTFMPLEFIEQNYNSIGEALKGLPRIHLLRVGNALKLGGVHMQKDDRIIERIVFDINAKQKQQEELEKGGFIK